MAVNITAKAEIKQLYKLSQLSGDNTYSLDISYEEAKQRIKDYASGKLIPKGNKQPFNEAHITLIEADQGQGKSNTATGLVVEAWGKDTANMWLWLLKKGEWQGEVKSYDRKTRVVKFKLDGILKAYQIPESYKLESPMQIFANYHLFGIPYVFIPSFTHLLYWLKKDVILDGWLLIDEMYLGAGARNSMTKLGKELSDQSFQMRKRQLEVVLITPVNSLLDKKVKLTPTKHIICSYNKIKREITLTERIKGMAGTKTLPPYDATQYWGNYWTNERISK
jgi:hypothetical protein